MDEFISGQPVFFKSLNYIKIFCYIGTTIENAENISESGVSTGFFEVRPGKQLELILQLFFFNFYYYSEPVKKLLELQEQAKNAKKGRWSDDDPKKHVRDIQWNIEPRLLVNKYANQKIDAIVEQVSNYIIDHFKKLLKGP